MYYIRWRAGRAQAGDERLVEQQLHDRPGERCAEGEPDAKEGDGELGEEDDDDDDDDDDNKTLIFRGRAGSQQYKRVAAATMGGRRLARASWGDFSGNWKII